MPHGYKSWLGSTVAVLASGPSMTQEDATYLRGKCKVIAVNETWKLAPWCDAIYSNDEDWWLTALHLDRVDERTYKTAQLVLGDSGKDATKLVKPYMHIVLPYYAELGVSDSASYLSWGGNSGYAALNLAYWFGASRIIMLGFDQGWDGDKPRWHGAHRLGLQNQKPGFHRWAKYFEQAALDYKRLGVKVVNCSRRTTLNCFTRAQLEVTI